MKELFKEISENVICGDILDKWEKKILTELL